jgi:thioredoxin 1
MSIRLVTVQISILVSFFLFFGCEKKNSDAEIKTIPPEKKGIETVTGLDHLNSIVENTPGKLLVFDLYADWCHPCKILAPVFSGLAADHAKSARFFRIDVGEHHDIAAAFRVRGIPLVVFIKDKQVVKAFTGLNPKESYEKVLTTCGPSVSADECKAKLNGSL